MSTVLPVDTALVFPSCTIVSASAGSGKTHTLTQRFIQLLLSDAVPHNSLKNILAITFTNQAATEMRRRLLEYLQRLCLGDDDALGDARDLLSMSDERIREKAGVVLTRILNEYSDLQIRTIDSFTATVFKASSFEFGFEPDLDIIFDNRELIADAFEQLMRELNSRSGLKETLGNLVNLMNETRSTKATFLWDPYARIQREVQRLYSQLASHEKELKRGGGLAEGMRIKERLRAQAIEFRDAIARSGMQIHAYMDNDLRSAEDGDPDALITRKKKEPDKIVKKLRGGIGERRFEEHRAVLEGHLERFNSLVDEFIIWKSQNHYQPYVDAIALVDVILFELKRRRKRILIEDINKTIRPLLRDSVADAYLMLGDQIFHFLIDEFQDTAPIQWANLFPLIENSLSQGGSFFAVGDTKQSIYAFRNADWRIMDRLMKENEFPAARKNVIPLKTNWRSFEEITRYTEHVFGTNVSSSSVAADAPLSGLSDVGQQVLDKNRRKGVVEVIPLSWDEENRPERPEILRLLSDCLARGYTERDVAILTQTNERVLEVGSWLNEAGFRVLPFSSLDIRTRKIVGEIISLLRFLDAPVDDLSFASFLLGDLFAANLESDGAGISQADLHAFLLSSVHQEGRRLHTYRSFLGRFPDLWKKYFEEPFRFVGYLPLYDLLAEVYRSFRLFDLRREEEASLVRLLEIAKEFSESDRNSVSDFLAVFDEETDAATWQVQVPAEVDAVRVMTVHKAKGLEFRVVLALLYDRDEWRSYYFFHDEPDGVRLFWINRDMAGRIPELARLYEIQRQKRSVDGLNQLYVSLTRARQEMFVLAVEGDRTKIPSSLLIPADSRLPLRPPAEAEPRETPVHLELSHSYGKIRYEETEADPIGFLEVERGKIVHAILSRIEFLEGETAALIEGLAGEYRTSAAFPLDWDSIRSTLVRFLENDSILPLFRSGPGRMVFREREFASADGSLLRMDRVIVDPGMVTVVDFKTGAKRNTGAYVEQLEEYLSIIADLYPKSNRLGVLAFVDQGRTETIR